MLGSEAFFYKQFTYWNKSRNRSKYRLRQIVQAATVLLVLKSSEGLAAMGKVVIWTWWNSALRLYKKKKNREEKFEFLYSD